MSFLSFLGLHPVVTSRLAGVIGFTYAYQALFASYAVPNKTEKYYDLAGSTGFITSTILSLYYPTVRSWFTSSPQALNFSLGAHHPRQLLVSAMMLLWAGRLGTYLFQRIMRDGSDSRFDDLKTRPLIFTGMWFGQALWVTLVGLPAYLVNSVPAAAHPALGLKDLIGVSIWAAGLGLEIIADREKSAWRAAKNDKKHEEKFISSGVWAWSRHPNYLGEVILQSGPPLLALTAPLPPTVKYLACISPFFSYVLLRYGSGVPPLEESAEKKWGKDEGWKKYRDQTSVLVPWPAGLGKGKA
ncbi:hypothetical protein CI109_101296 [Kwoniella shandongensis]|uniref:Steroid 5-alpha reductase C-terminal domain-containing protein n=1 Tax=Kwoniella shandongensis TaxID=1734106 RepID=A0A5M6BVT4_9TREE|nr:uncharacterized protein CI109_005328 [Kwoniella shandongensis]KAA5526371.1 hypothetical protein CI109_005328 [Kwoniella shandongensis]